MPLEIVNLKERMSEDAKQGIASMLEDLDILRDQIANGEITAFAYCTVSNERGLATGWNGYAHWNDLGFGVSLLCTNFNNMTLEDE